jgi:hypothetical protein
VGGEHDRAAGWHVVDVVDEHHSLTLEALDHDPVVDDLVVAVHRRVERVHHPGEGLDRHLDAGTEPSRLGEQDTVDRHVDPLVVLRMARPEYRRSGPNEAASS